MKKVTVGIIGLGTVGGGTLELLTKERSRLKQQGINLEVKSVCSLQKPSAKELKIPASVTFTKDANTLISDPEIDIVVEVVSSVPAGAKIIEAALKAGKHVVSANKAALDQLYPKIAKQLEKQPELRVGIEAAVAGGIPVIGTLEKHFAADPVERIVGILNGTTNFIITKMEQEGLDYGEVLKEAQERGYAEADPTADVEGYDARSKISLLSQLAFGYHPHKTIPTQGISSLAGIDFEYAALLGSTIRCLSVAYPTKAGLVSYVSPTVVHKQSSYASIMGATNAVSFDSKYQQNTLLVGQGAGRYPTAASVVADVVAIATGSCYSIASQRTATVTNMADAFDSRFYIRLVIKDGLGIIEKIGDLCQRHKISIDSILQLPIDSPKALPFVVTTDECSSKAIEKLVKDLKKQAFVVGDPVTMPIFDRV